MAPSLQSADNFGGFAAQARRSFFKARFISRFSLSLLGDLWPRFKPPIHQRAVAIRIVTRLLCVISSRPLWPVFLAWVRQAPGLAVSGFHVPRRSLPEKPGRSFVYGGLGLILDQLALGNVPLIVGAASSINPGAERASIRASTRPRLHPG